VETGLAIALAAGLAWAPFWLGGNRLPPWSVNGVFFPSLMLIYEGYLLSTGRRHPIAIGRVGVSVALFGAALCWAIIQSSPALAPSLAHPIWAMTSDALGRAVAGTISVNPGLGMISTLRLVTIGSVFWLSLQIGRNEERAQGLLNAIASIVAAYSAYGIVLSAFFGGAIPFFGVSDGGFSVRSTFVNRNNFATYAGLGLIVTCGLFLNSLGRSARDLTEVWTYRLTRLIEATGRDAWRILGGGLLSLVALLGSGSRGGVISTLLAFIAFPILAAARSRRRRNAPIEAIILMTFVLVAGFFFYGDLVVGRISSGGIFDTNRLSVYSMVVRSIFDNPILGLGYGAFVDAFPMYRDRSISAFEVWDKAHQTYLETWQGLGLIFGSACIGATALLVGKCFAGAIGRRRNETPALVAACASLLVWSHALVDFSIQIDAIALTYSAILGIGVAQSESSRHTIANRTTRSFDDDRR